LNPDHATDEARRAIYDEIQRTFYSLWVEGIIDGFQIHGVDSIPAAAVEEMGA